MLILNIQAQGFSLIEALIATLIVAISSTAIYKLELMQLNGLTFYREQQQAYQLAYYLSNQMIGNFNINESNNNLSLENYTNAEQFDSKGDYNANHNIAVDCSYNPCTQLQLAQYQLYLWKKSFNTYKINSLQGTVCKDSTFKTPDTFSPLCDGKGRVIIKLVWQSAHVGSKTAKNFINLTVPVR